MSQAAKNVLIQNMVFGRQKWYKGVDINFSLSEPSISGSSLSTPWLALSICALSLQIRMPHAAC